MKYVYDEDDDETVAEIDGEEFATMDGKVSRWRNGVPHPDTNAFEAFETGLLQLSTPKEREVILHLLTSTIERDGFEQD